MDIPAPQVTAELIDWLSRLFPNRLPIDVTTSFDEVRALQGEQRVIARLKRVMDEQREDSLSQ